MKWAYHIRHKVMSAGIVAIIIAIILINNFSEEKKYEDIDSSIASIYQDRLLPATYIYELSNHLYQKQLDHEHAADFTKQQLSNKDVVHDAAIKTLIDNYEVTYLTKEEKQYWAAFKSNLKKYNALCANNETSNEVLSETLATTIKSLNSLSELQAGVGRDLLTNSKAVIGSTLFTGQIENSMLVVLGLIAMVLLSVSDKRIYQQNQNARLN